MEMNRIDHHGEQLRSASFRDVNLGGADFTAADLRDAHFSTHRILRLSGVTDEIGKHRIIDTVCNAGTAGGKAPPSGSPKPS